MKKTYLYLIALAIFSGIAWFAINRNAKDTIPESEKEFYIKDIDKISKILLAGKDERKIVLEKTAYGWSVNNNYLARYDAIENLLKTIRDMRAEYPVPEVLRNNVVKQLATSAIKVEVYDTDLQLIKTFYVGDAASEYNGSYMILEDAETPFVVRIPGFKGFLTTRFFLDEAEWKDRTIFRYAAEHIHSVTINYPELPEGSFKIKLLSADSFEITKMSQSSSKLPYNKEKVQFFISFFKMAAAEAYNNDNSKKDSILQTQPFAIISVEDTTGFVNEVKFYHKAVDRRTKLQSDKDGNPLPFDIDRHYASTNKDKDFMLVQDLTFGKFFRRVEEFEREADTRLEKKIYLLNNF